MPNAEGLAPVSRDEIADRAGALLHNLRQVRPRVHCITNSVAQAFTANALLALGVVPSMTTSPGEVGDFVAHANALLINLGTLDTEREHAIDVALSQARDQNCPVVLDPVFIERSPLRAKLAHRLAGQKPAVIRLNAVELEALAAGFTGASGLQPVAQAKVVAAATGASVALTGKTDLVCDRRRAAQLGHGDVLMTRVTAMGCAGSAIVAAALGVEHDAWFAATGALLILGICGEIAAEQAQGPGSFAVRLLDTLYSVDPETIRTRASVA